MNGKVRAVRWVKGQNFDVEMAWVRKSDGSLDFCHMYLITSTRWRTLLPCVAAKLSSANIG